MTARRTSPLVKILAWVFAIFGVLIVVVAAISDSEPSVSRQESDGAVLAGIACATAQQAVKEHLKAPTTAKFTNCHQARSNEDRTTYFVKGYVDSENSFGATLRSEYAAFLTREEGSSEMTVDRIAIE